MNEIKIFYTVYKITNKINGNIYIGAHQTTDLNDEYFGSGVAIQRAIKKYGLESFYKEYIKIFLTAEEMYNFEAELVNCELINSGKSYNIAIGGRGGSSKTPSVINKISSSMKKFRKNAPEEYRRIMSETIKRRHERGEIKYDTFTGKHHSDATKRKIGAKTSKSQSGTGNSQYGTKWIHNPDLKISKKIKNGEKLPDGWKFGRYSSLH